MKSGEKKKGKKSVKKRGKKKVKKKVLFVCVGNAYRSIMAEAYARHWFADKIHVESAGIRPLGFVPEDVLEVLREDGIPEKIISQLMSKPIDVQRLKDFDCIIVLSDTYFFAPEGVKVLYFYVDDPAFSTKEILINAREKIKDIVSKLPYLLEDERISLGSLKD